MDNRVQLQVHAGHGGLYEEETAPCRRAHTRKTGPLQLVDRLRDEARILERWLFEAALPLWWSNGADHDNGGFEDLLDRQGAPVAAPRRARVQARQIYVYARAGAMGWSGPWRDAMEHGLDYFLTRYFREDGLVRGSVSPAGAPLDEGPALYDQAFGLLALSSAAAASESPGAIEDRARDLLDAIDAQFGLAGSGYASGDPARPYQSNPHMHLLEACLAWMTCASSPIWSDRAARIAELAMTRFVDGSTGALREFFDDQWSPAAGRDGTIIEPGHQFEWAWLLQLWGRLAESRAAITIAGRLFEIGAGPGVDRDRNVAIGALDDRLRPLDGSARLWPQTERIKAAVRAAECGAAVREQRLAELIDGVAGLKRYLLPNGTWCDRLTTENVFVEEPAPASSLYHIIGAIAEVTCAARSEFWMA